MQSPSYIAVLFLILCSLYMDNTVHFMKIVHSMHWRIHGRRQGCAHHTSYPPNGPFSFIFMQFWGKIGLIIAFLSASLKLAPPWKSWIRHCSVVHFIFVP